MKNRNAAGPDGIFPETIQKTVDTASDVNELLASQRFLSQWKRVRLVLIRKKGNWKLENAESTSSYRPICMLDTIGKLYEILNRERLLKELDAKRVLSEMQFISVEAILLPKPSVE